MKVTYFFILLMSSSYAGLSTNQSIPLEENDNFSDVNSWHNTFTKEQKNILKKINNKSLSIKKTMTKIVQGVLSLESLPEAFFSYHSMQEILPCSPYKDATGFTPLMWIVINANYYDEFFEKIMTDARILKTINEKNSAGWTALSIAVRNVKTMSNEKIVRQLVKAKADVDAQDHAGFTPLMLSAKYANHGSSEEMVKFLIDSGADVNMKNATKNTALIEAAMVAKKYSTLNTLQILIDAKAEINAQGSSYWTALMVAASRSQTESSDEAVSLLLKNGADVTIKSPKGNTALILALLNFKTKSSQKTVQILMDAGSTLDASELCSVLDQYGRAKQRRSKSN